MFKEFRKRDKTRWFVVWFCRIVVLFLIILGFIVLNYVNENNIKIPPVRGTIFTTLYVMIGYIIFIISYAFSKITLYTDEGKQVIFAEKQAKIYTHPRDAHLEKNFFIPVSKNEPMIIISYFNEDIIRVLTEHGIEGYIDSVYCRGENN